jgi:hypothetical protein
MDAIKDFRRDCYQRLTSFAEFAHRITDEMKAGCETNSREVPGDTSSVPGLDLLPESRVLRRPTTFTQAFSAKPLARRYGQKPHQQSEQDQSAEQGEKRVQRMKVEVGIPRETISCSQHKTSPLHPFRVRPDGPPDGILPLFTTSGYSFLGASVTPFEWLRRLPWLLARRAASDC